MSNCVNDSIISFFSIGSIEFNIFKIVYVKLIRDVLGECKTGISLKGSKIDNPTKNSIKIYKTPSKKDKYILKILDKDSNVISLIGLGDPFYIHLQHIGYEDSRVFGGYIQRDFDIPVSLDSKATHMSLMEQNKFGLKEIRRIEIN